MRKRHEEPKTGFTVETESKKHFNSWQWKEAIMFYLHEVWADHFSRQEFATILFVSGFQEHLGATTFVTISFDAERESYKAHGSVSKLTLPLSEKNVLRIQPRTVAEFERGLARFARSRRYKALILPLPDPAHIKTLVFWNRRGDLWVGCVE